MCILVTSIKKRAQIANKWANMKDKDILLNLAITRGSLSKEKRQILKKYFPSASASFLNLTSLYYTIFLLVYLFPNCSTFRIYEHARIKNKITLTILLKFGLLSMDKKGVKNIYNVTPLTRVIIADLIAAYKTNLTTFEHLNLIDKKANYLEIKQKIKTLKQK
jgi:hypothetical protein